MSLESDFLDLAASLVVVTPLSTVDGYGAPVYGAATTAVPAVVDYAATLVPAGRSGNVGIQQETARGIVFVLSTSLSINPSDKFVVDGVQEDILSINTVHDDEGQHHLEVFIR